MAEGGVVAQSDDGKLYFIPESVFEACLVEGGYAQQITALLEDTEVEGFTMGPGGPTFRLLGFLPASALDGVATPPGPVLPTARMGDGSV